MRPHPPPRWPSGTCCWPPSCTSPSRAPASCRARGCCSASPRGRRLSWSWSTPRRALARPCCLANGRGAASGRSPGCRWTPATTTRPCSAATWLRHWTCAGIAEQVAALLGGPQPAPPEAVVTALVNTLAVHSDQAVLVLDDYHSGAISNRRGRLPERRRRYAGGKPTGRRTSEETFGRGPGRCVRRDGAIRHSYVVRTSGPGRRRA
jgi:hypothetical protein